MLLLPAAQQGVLRPGPSLHSTTLQHSAPPFQQVTHTRMRVPPTCAVPRGLGQVDGGQVFAWPARPHMCALDDAFGSTCCPLPLPALDVSPKHYPCRTRPSPRGLLVYPILCLNQEGTSCVSLDIYPMLPHAMGWPPTAHQHTKPATWGPVLTHHPEGAYLRSTRCQPPARGRQDRQTCGNQTLGFKSRSASSQQTSRRPKT